MICTTMSKEKSTIMTIAVLIIAATITTTTTTVYGVSPKSLCSEYDGDWSNGKCKGKRRR